MKQFFLSTLALIFVAATVLAQKENATAIVKQANDLVNGRSSKSAATMTIVRPTWKRSISMKTWSLGEDYYMILITAPAEDKGQVFLKRKNEMWNWLPSISRIIKIPPSMMGQNWLCSDFTNNDLVKANSIVDDYTHSIIGNEKIEGYDCYKIQLIPKQDAAVVWNKIILWIAKDKHFILQGQYFDEDGQLVNQETESDIRRFGDRELPSKMTMIPVREKGKQTIIQFESMEFNQAINQNFFSQQNMKTLR